MLLIVAAWVLAFYFYAHFPEQVVSHWNYYGQPDDYSGRATGAFAIPALLAGMYLLFLALPWLDPRSERYAEFGKIYNFIKSAIMLVLFGVYVAAGLYNLGYPVKIGSIVPWLVGGLLIVIGNYMGKIKRNWFMGVRTPWTLSSENVWNKTNRFGGFMMMLFGLSLVINPFLPKMAALVLLILGGLLVTVGTIVYSFVLYKQERKQAQDLIVK